MCTLAQAVCRVLYTPHTPPSPRVIPSTAPEVSSTAILQTRKMKSKQSSNSPTHNTGEDGAGFSFPACLRRSAAGERAQASLPVVARADLHQELRDLHKRQKTTLQQGKHPLQRNQTSHSGDGRPPHPQKSCGEGFKHTQEG